MSKKNNQRPIIIKRVTEEESGHHGGSWKIAYADFMTSMMAFFLIMWLINATTEQQRRGIAQFFNPMADKDAALKSTNATLESNPSPFSKGHSLQQINKAQKHTEAPSETRFLSPEHHENDATFGIKQPILTPTPPAIIPIGGPKSGAARHTGYVGANAQKESAAQQSAQQAQQAQLTKALKGLQHSMAQNPNTRANIGNMSIRVERNDIRIELHDTNKASMFDTGSTHLNKTGRAMITEIAKWLAPLPENISIIGHTDAQPYRGRHETMSNWTLSVLRADDAREALVNAGYPNGKILDVTGVSDRDLAFPNDPTAPGNRRIVIIIHERISSLSQQTDQNTQSATAASTPAPEPAIVPIQNPLPSPFQTQRASTPMPPDPPFSAAPFQ